MSSTAIALDVIKTRVTSSLGIAKIVARTSSGAEPTIIDSTIATELTALMGEELGR